MLIIGLTESSARFITAMIAVFVVMGFFGWLSQALGINPFVLIGIFIALFATTVTVITIRSSTKGFVLSKRRCDFIRANGSQCVKAKGSSSDYCGHHADKMDAAEAVPVAIARAKRSQCGFVKDDGSKCKRL